MHSYGNPMQTFLHKQFFFHIRKYWNHLFILNWNWQPSFILFVLQNIKYILHIYWHNHELNKHSNEECYTQTKSQIYYYDYFASKYFFFSLFSNFINVCIFRFIFCFLIFDLHFVCEISVHPRDSITERKKSEANSRLSILCSNTVSWSKRR